MKLKLVSWKNKIMFILGLVLLIMGIVTLNKTQIPVYLPIMLIVLGIIDIFSAFYRSKGNG